MMRVAVAFILLISLALAFKLEKQRLPFEDETDEQTDLQEQDEFGLNERGDHDEQKEREEQDENDGDSKVTEWLKIGSCTKKKAWMPFQLVKLANVLWPNEQTEFLASNQARN